MKKYSLLVTLSAAGALFATSSLSAQTIFDHTFDEGTGELVGTAEDFSGTIWSNATAALDPGDPDFSTSDFNANGTAGGANTGVWLPVTIETGNQYVLTLGSMAGANWTAGGFANANGNRSFNLAGVGGFASILVNGGNGTAFLGEGTGNQVFSSSLNTAVGTETFTDVWDIQITLDTTTALWSVDYAARAAGDTGAFTAIVSGAYTTNPTINYVGISANNTGDIDTFSLVAAIPEPGTYALLAGCFGLTAVILRRRMR